MTKIAPVLERVDLSKTLVNLESLSLSLSHHLEENLTNETSEFSLAAGQGHVDDIKRLLELCPNLGSLELHWYNLHSYEISGAQTEEQGIFCKIAQLDNHFSKLRHCRLDGIDTDGTALLVFFKQTTQLTRLTMDHVYLKSGTFAPVFDFLTNHLRHLTYLHLETLHETHRICFDGRGKAWLPSTYRTNGPNELTRTGVDGQRTIGYRFFKGRVQGSPDVIRWRRKQAVLYGPPLLNHQR